MSKPACEMVTEVTGISIYFLVLFFFANQEQNIFYFFYFKVTAAIQMATVATQMVTEIT